MLRYGMAERTYRCGVCGFESTSNWAVGQCEFQHDAQQWAGRLGMG